MNGACVYTRGERLADSGIHLLGMSAALIACSALAVAGHQSRSILVSVAVGLYGIGLLAMLGSSAVYHLVKEGRWKGRFRRLDHAAIFVMIAGTYTPVIVLAMPGPWGWSLLSVVWAGAVAGAAVKFLAPGRFERLSVLAYLALGWVGMAAIGPLLDALRTPDMVLLAAGGLLYSSGVLMHLSTRLRYHNALWHLFVLVAAGCHFVAVYRLVLAQQA
ncbi:PAQR family membrane homeostasis protein TrhA [Neoroseomonas soli]|uniref:Hemolysin III family protein n=1 Tax=Neoroseomonas soli TaxID=1081025 RepID=A0A9X9WTV1_9PROT|nr:hemolysin III family protein [Neoroseomonas soli]MBR0670580.1 hemolysin III family protein [Neoroseomonas soli]